MTRVLRRSLALLCFIAVSACMQRPASAQTGAFPATVVFVSFYDNHVTLTINGEVVMNRVLRADRSNELSGSREVMVQEQNRFVLVVDGAEVTDVTIGAARTTRTIYVWQGAKPPIWASNYPPALD